MTNYKLLLQYHGARYAGWQIQKNQATIQGILEAAMQRISGEETSVIAAGRTDAGVHALGQVAHFRLQQELPVDYLLRSLNGVLPWDIRMLRIRLAPAGFHAQKDAKKKRYEYRIYNGRILSPFLYNYVYQAVAPLQHEAMQEACSYIGGTHDFSGFAAAASRVKNRTRTIFLSRLQKKGRLLIYQVEGNGFLHHMIRNIVGTLLQIGSGKRPPKDMARILHSRDRRTAGPTAPAHGLYLVRIWY